MRDAATGTELTLEPGAAAPAPGSWGTTRYRALEFVKSVVTHEHGVVARAFWVADPPGTADRMVEGIEVSWIGGPPESKVAKTVTAAIAAADAGQIPSRGRVVRVPELSQLMCAVVHLWRSAPPTPTPREGAFELFAVRPTDFDPGTMPARDRKLAQLLLEFSAVTPESYVAHWKYNTADHMIRRTTDTLVREVWETGAAIAAAADLNG